MIHNLSNNIAIFFYKNNLIENNDIAICCYGMELIISTFVGFISIIFTSFFLNDISFGVLYLLYIVPIRMNVGGYHANSYSKCNFVFLCFFIIAYICYRNFNGKQYEVLNYINLMSSVLVYKLVPLENKNKTVNDFKKIMFKKSSVSIYVLCSIVGIALKKMCFINILTIVLANTTILLLIGKGVALYENKFEEKCI